MVSLHARFRTVSLAEYRADANVRNLFIPIGINQLPRMHDAVSTLLLHNNFTAREHSYRRRDNYRKCCTA